MNRLRYFFWIIAMLIIPGAFAADGQNTTFQLGATSSCVGMSSVAAVNCSKVNDLNLTSLTGNPVSNIEMAAAIIYDTSIINPYFVNMSVTGKIFSGSGATTVRCRNASTGNYNTIGTFTLTTTTATYYINGSWGCSMINVSSTTVYADVELNEILIWNGTNSTGPAPAPPNLTATVLDAYDSTAIQNFSLMIKRGSSIIYNATTDTGTIIVSNITNGMANLTFQSNQSGGYLERFYGNVNISGQSFQGKIFQGWIEFDAYEVISGRQLASFQVTAPLQTNTSYFGGYAGSCIFPTNCSGIATLLLKAGNYNISGNLSSYNGVAYVNTTLNITVLPMSTNRHALTFGTNILKIGANDIFTNASVSNFNISLVGVNTSYSTSGTTTNGNVSFLLLNALQFNATFTSQTYAWYSQLVTTTTQLQNETFRVYPINSIFISIYDIATSLLLTPNNILAQFTSPTNAFNQSTITGTILSTMVAPEDYQVRLSTTGYTTRDYFFTLSSGSNIVLNAYMQNSSSLATITFTVKDERTSDPIENALFSVSRRVNTTWVTIAQAYTDIVGEAAFVLSQSEEYRFTIVLDGYMTRTFDLTPTSTAYTIFLAPEAEVDFTTIYNIVDFVTLPISNFITSTGFTNFSIITAARPGASINYFGLWTRIQGNYLSTNVTGSLGGGTASLSINLSSYNVSTIDVIYFIGVDGYQQFDLNRTFAYEPDSEYGNNTVDDALVFVHSNLPILVQSIFAIIIILVAVVSFRSAGATGRAMNFVAGCVAAMLGYYDIIDATLSIILVILLTATFLFHKREDI